MLEYPSTKDQLIECTQHIFNTLVANSNGLLNHRDHTRMMEFASELAKLNIYLSLCDDDKSDFNNIFATRTSISSPL